MLMYSLVHTIVLLTFGALLVAAAAEDVRRLIVPNRFCLAIAGLYPAYLLVAPVEIDWPAALAVAGASLAVGLVAFARGYAGGGDVKLFAATALWAGPALFAPFLLMTSLTGLVVGLAMLAQRWLSRRSRVAMAGRVATGPAADGPGEAAEERKSPPLPYAVAIAAGGLMVATILLNGG